VLPARRADGLVEANQLTGQVEDGLARLDRDLGKPRGLIGTLANTPLPIFESEIYTFPVISNKAVMMTRQASRPPSSLRSCTLSKVQQENEKFLTQLIKKF